MALDIDCLQLLVVASWMRLECVPQDEEHAHNSYAEAYVGEVFVVLLYFGI